MRGSRPSATVGDGPFALVVVGALIGTLLLTPAGAHVAGWSHNWTQHIRPKADQRYIQERKVLSATVNHAGGASPTIMRGPDRKRRRDRCDLQPQDRPVHLRRNP